MSLSRLPRRWNSPNPLGASGRATFVAIRPSTDYEQVRQRINSNEAYPSACPVLFYALQELSSPSQISHQDVKEFLLLFVEDVMSLQQA